VADALLERGEYVLGVDKFVDFYDREIKELNRASLEKYPNFSFKEIDVNDLTLKDLENIEVIIHQAAQAGVRKSWGENFQSYTSHNIMATQRLLEISSELPLQRFIYASSSSVYGQVKKLPVTEDQLPSPISPYGVTKLAAEHLCHLYYYNYQVPVVSLRYFTVYGPGQRPDMAFHRFIRALLTGDEIEIYGDGEQTRDFTYIKDIVKANLSALSTSGITGKVFNLGGGHRTTIKEVIKLLEPITGKKARLNFYSPQKGDPRDTMADTSRAQNYLSYSPGFNLEEGLSRQVTYMEELLQRNL